MSTNCVFIVDNKEFDFIDKDLIGERMGCNFPHYNNGEGCSSCPVYKQMIETNNANLEYLERMQDIIDNWWT